jgi:hypothetical protein
MEPELNIVLIVSGCNNSNMVIKKQVFSDPVEGIMVGCYYHAEPSSAISFRLIAIPKFLSTLWKVFYIVRQGTKSFHFFKLVF